MELLDYIRKNYKTPNIAVLKTLGATDELIKYLTNTPNNTNMKIVESLISGDSDEGNGIKSITVSPALDTTPTLDSLFPFYWDESQADDGWVEFDWELTVSSLIDGEYTVTITPTSEWRVKYTSQVAEKGQPLTFNVIAENGFMIITPEVETEDSSKGINVNVRVIGSK